MPEAPLWDNVHNVEFFYDDEDDTVVISPVDDDGEVHHDASIAFAARSMDWHLAQLHYAKRECMRWRRIYWAASKRGISLEAVRRRQEGEWLADDIDSALRESHA